MKRFALCAFIFAAVLLAARGVRAATITVDVSNSSFSLSFSPAAVTIVAGDTVQWNWVAGTHSTTSDTRLWDSGVQGVPFSFLQTFGTPGDYPYYCSLHGSAGGIGMSGIVRVGLPHVRGDFDGDARSDIFWRHTSDAVEHCSLPGIDGRTGRASLDRHLIIVRRDYHAEFAP